MAMATRVGGEEEGKVGMGDGDGNEETATRRRRDYDKTTTRRDDDETTTRRCQRTKEATGGTWMDSIEDTGELRTDNTAGGAETTRFWCEYVISNNLTHLACVYYTIFLDPDM